MDTVWIDGYEQLSCFGVGARALADASVRDFRARCEESWPWLGPPPDFDFDELTGLGKNPETRQMDVLGKYVVACSSLLLKASTADPPDGDRTGVVLGSAFGCTASNHAFLEDLVTAGPRRTSPTVFRNTVSNAAAGHLATTFRLRGSNTVLNSGMVSGAQALAYAFEILASGRCATVLAGAGDWLSDILRSRFVLQSQRHGKPALPLLDGACMFTLSAGARPSPGRWQMLGYAQGFLASEDREGGLAGVVEAAIRSVGAAPDEVDAMQTQADLGALWIRSHRSESLERTCGEHAKKLAPLPFAENSALPAALALSDSLCLLGGARASGALLRDGLDPAGTPRRTRTFVFSSVGADGNVVVLVFRSASA